jgi:hypothetical protein
MAVTFGECSRRPNGAEPHIRHRPVVEPGLRPAAFGLESSSQHSIPMLIPSSIASLHPAPLLTVDRVRAVLKTCGYRSTAVLIAGAHSLPPGSTLSLQFGDQIAMGVGGATRLTIRCSLQINCVDDRIYGVTYWQIGKSFQPAAGPDGFDIAIEADMILGGGGRLADVLAHGEQAYRHLRMLIADARATLLDLRIDDRSGPGRDGPIVRIEVKFLGDLAAGRSGLVVSAEPRILQRASTTTAHLRMTQAACDCLSDDIVPNLARAIRSMILQLGPPIVYSAEGAETGQRSSAF